MAHSPEAQEFLARIVALPTGPVQSDMLSEALQPSLLHEAALRSLWSADRSSARLNDPYVGLVDVFEAPGDIRKTRARIVTDADDQYAQYVFPIPSARRRKEGEPAMVATMMGFKSNWALFTEGSLSLLSDWSNIIVAGGSVQACLAPVPDSVNGCGRAMRKYYHVKTFPTSDIDIFLYGLSPQQAEEKMRTIYAAVRQFLPCDITCVRTKHTISIHSQYPYRTIQIVLRLYSSPAEILSGFDVDAACCAFDGERVWATPRAIVAMMRQCNTVDMTHRSPSYEVRLAKYSMRDFEVHVPSLRREMITPIIYETQPADTLPLVGLALLLAFERELDSGDWDCPMRDVRELSTRLASVAVGGYLENDYDLYFIRIPYGSGWNARKTVELVRWTDDDLNSPDNAENDDRRLHRHAAFVGSMDQCLEDACGCCPVPQNASEKALQDKEDGVYVRGHVQFVDRNPGRQVVSSTFRPNDEGEWAVQAYSGTPFSEK